MNTAKRKVVILGAGYAGGMRPTDSPDQSAEVDLVNPIPEFVERIRLARGGRTAGLGVGNTLVDRPTRSSRGAHATRLGTVTRMRPDDQEVDYGVAGQLR